MTVASFPTTHCNRCGSLLTPGGLMCPHCGAFVHIDQLNQLTARALQLESTNPIAAIGLWRQCLGLLPADSPQYQSLQQRIGLLSAGMMQSNSAEPIGIAPSPTGLASGKSQSFLVAAMKTLGSMVLSIAVYYLLLFHDWSVAIGFVVLMLVHEMGHVIANRFYGINASPPIFVPFLGAVINLKQRPPNAKVEAVIGIAGTIGALVCYGYYLQTGSELALDLSWFGFMLNLFNLLPVPPLDGGRVTAAVSPWAWVAGLIGLGWMFVSDLVQYGHPDWILLLVLAYAFPRIRATLAGKARFDPYYKISRRASWTIGVLYVVLGLGLLYLYHVTNAMVRFG
jgi:Zn-dependent protease